MNICPVCGSKEWIKRYRISAWDIEECSVCGFAGINPPPAKEGRAQCYSEEKVIERNIKRKNFFQKLSRFLKRVFKKIAKRDKSAIFYNDMRRYLPRSSKILDIGCGDGSFISRAKEYFICTGIEISEYLASLARRRPGIKVITGDFLDVNFANERYDGITLISILEHLEDPARAIKKCFDLLGDSGVLLLKTVNYGCVNRRIKKGAWTGFRPPDHAVYFNPHNLRLLLKKAGFGKIYITAMPFNDNMYCQAWR